MGVLCVRAHMPVQDVVLMRVSYRCDAISCNAMCVCVLVGTRMRERYVVHAMHTTKMYVSSCDPCVAQACHATMCISILLQVAYRYSTICLVTASRFDDAATMCERVNIMSDRNVKCPLGSDCS